MGGAVAMTAFASDAPKADGLILIAPAVWSRSEMPLLYRVLLWTVAHTVRSMSL
jgi:acylglycerol lipase